MSTSFIDLYREPLNAGDPIGTGGWMARFRGGCAKEVMAAFDTDTLPTPFLAQVHFEAVREAVEGLNPEAVVSCRHFNTSSVPGVGVVTCGDCGMRW